MNPEHAPTARPAGERLDLMEEVNRLDRELFESRKATESVQAAAEDARQKYHAELKRRGDTIAELLVKLNDRTNHARFSAGGLVETLNALKALRTLVMEGKVSNDAISWPGEVFRALEAADDVIRKYDIPF